MAARPNSTSGGRPSGGSERKYQQDFITRIRYQNHLPAPPQPPKLLEIPSTAATEYTNANFASRLVREQPLNVEVDSELGMPLDLLPFGPAIFSASVAIANASLQPPEVAPKPHPHDLPLLRPISALGKPSHAKAGVSFLRRTEYISNEGSKSTFQSTTSSTLIENISKNARRHIKATSNDPVAMLQAVIRGFDVANPAKGKWALPKHPMKPDVKAVNTWPVLPDLEAHPDGMGYVIVKLSTNPVATTSHREEKLDFALLRPWNDEGAAEDYKFHYYLPDGDAVSKGVKRKYHSVDTSSDGYTHTSTEGRKFYRFKRHRAYEYVVPPEVMKEPYREVVLVMHNGDEDADDGEGRQRGAYFSPIFQRNSLRPMRTKDVDEEEASKADIAEVKFRGLLSEENDRIQDAVTTLTDGD